MPEDFLGSGLALPLQMDHRGGIALVSDDEDVRQAIWIILSTAPGERPMRPDFGCGIHDVVFEAVDAYTIGRLEQKIRIALDQWEPRIDVVAIETDLSNVGEGQLLIDIHYALRGTNDERNLVYPFYVIPAEE